LKRIFQGATVGGGVGGASVGGVTVPEPAVEGTKGSRVVVGSVSVSVTTSVTASVVPSATVVDSGSVENVTGRQPRRHNFTF
jgi:hypothetical protein